MSRALVIALALAAAAPALGQERARFASPPADRSETAVLAWTARNIEKGAYDYVGADNDGARYLFVPEFQDLLAGDSVRAWVRTEFFNPQVGDELTYRSANILKEFDCAERRLRDLAGDAFPLLNLQGEPHSEDAQAPKWRYLRLGDIEREELKAACAARLTMRVEQARERAARD